MTEIKKWEYRVIDFEDNYAGYDRDDRWTDFVKAEEELNLAGEEGWELVSVLLNGKAIFKRPKT